MDVCLCSNYYSSIRCTNTVGKFGERCKLCIVLKSGTSLSPGMLPDDCLWMTASSHSSVAAEADAESDSKSDKSSTTEPPRRPSWAFAALAGAAAWSSGKTSARMQ